MMNRNFFKIDFDTVQGILDRVRQIGSGQIGLAQFGIRPRVIAVILIAFTVVYASVDLSLKIRRAAGPFPQIEKAALPAAEAGPAGRKAPGNAAGKQAIESYQVIAARNLFGSTDKEAAGPGGGILAGGLEQSMLQLDLIGTIAEEDGNGRAVIDDKKKVRSYKVGDQVADATIVKIMRNSVVLKAGDREEILTMKVRQSQPPRPAPGPPQTAVQPQAQQRPPGGAASVLPAAGAVQGPAGTVRDILNQAGARPHFESGKMDGFYIGRVAEGSLLKKYGLENGDIIEGINEQSLQKPDDIFNLQNMKNAPGGKTVLKIKRQGRPMTLNLNME